MTEVVYPVCYRFCVSFFYLCHCRKFHEPLPVVPLKVLAHNELVGRVIGKERGRVRERERGREGEREGGRERERERGRGRERGREGGRERLFPFIYLSLYPL